MLLDNRYRILRTLGSGGFGETFLAEDTHMPSQRRCVIKQLKPIHNNSQIYQLVQERFQREAAILEDLGGNSDQIPALYAYFQLNEQFYLVQEYIEGDTLTAKIKQQGLFSESAIRELLISLLPVIEYVHSKRIVHRDIKPENIILRHRDGKPVLIDFGAVRETMGTAINSQGSLTSSIVIGTPGYMPSEQAMGRPVYVSDLYSLGMTAIYLLTGKHPHELEIDPSTGELIWDSRTFNIHETLTKVLKKAIAYNPRDRFSSAREMLDALQTGILPDAISVNPTIPFTQPPSTVPPPFQTAPQQTIPFSPKPPSQEHSPEGSKSKGMVIKGIIGAGSAIATLIIIGFVITKSSQQVVQQKVPPSVQVPIITPQVTSLPTRASVITPLTPQEVSQSEDNYAWLSQREVKDADLVDKNGFELDVMRNSIFARHGRRFDTPGIQQYFNTQNWYIPKYSPQEFPPELLSDIERWNVEYINRYQDRYNRRYFRK
ncbi:MAG: YARHG domain-containing protein [Scytonema sp. PMC 1069.18]|nr:YARHG domain-containing protein [Scytonema sp. PMC 1069.18]MEC4886370.1 YARHG domain-containing protein [Scytonema sp. PMC 1070.18]